MSRFSRSVRREIAGSVFALIVCLAVLTSVYWVFRCNGVPVAADYPENALAVLGFCGLRDAWRIWRKYRVEDGAERTHKR